MSQERGDAAAIMIGAVVLGFSIFSKDGAYEEAEFGEAIAVLLILIAYLWPSRRTVLQSVAMACVIGGCTVPIVGYLTNVLAHSPPDPGTFWDNMIATVSWILFGLIALFFDRFKSQDALKA
jgi:hypothetical protein